jgi:hypothetical protein
VRSTSVFAAAVIAVLLAGSIARAGQDQTSPPHSESPTAAAHPATPGPGAGHASAAHADDPVPHPVLPAPARWPGTMAIVILSMFAAAAVVGPIVRANMPEEVPPAHSHDEPPGASHHHGKSGMLNVEPGHGHSSGHH